MNSVMNVAKLLVVCQKIEGRKKLQKIVHILQSAGYGKDFPQQFGYLHYGPYSHEVKADIDLLLDPSGPLAMEKESTAGVSNRTFTYSPAPELVEAVKTTETAPWETLAKQLNAQSAQELEAISTILFLQRSGEEETMLAERFKQLKPSLADKFEAAMATAKELLQARPNRNFGSPARATM